MAMQPINSQTPQKQISAPVQTSRCLTDEKIKKVILTLIPILLFSVCILIGALTGSPIIMMLFAICGAGLALYGTMSALQNWPVGDEKVRHDLLNDSLESLGEKYSFDNLAKRGLISKENAEKMDSLYHKLPIDGEITTKTQRQEDFTKYYKHKSALKYFDKIEKIEKDFNTLRAQPNFLNQCY